jgi:hypothetical protein
LVAELKSTRAVEKLAQGLAIFSFVSICWVTHRVLQERTQCVSSSFLSFVQIGGVRVDNCRFESRLSLHQIFRPVPQESAQMVRALEVLEPLEDVLLMTSPRLAVEINLEAPHIFEIGRGYLRLGREWLNDGLQTRRALIMGVLKNHQPDVYANAFQLEVMTDFLLTSVLDADGWKGHSLRGEVKFPTSSPSFEQYCKSPFRSLAHGEYCALNAPAAADTQAGVWGFRPLLAAGLVRLFDKASIKDKLNVLEAIRAGRALPPLPTLSDDTIESQAHWLERALREQTAALGFSNSEAGEFALKQTLRELDVSTPTRWELTVDITNTPAWKDVLEQFRKWTKLRPRDRVLVFTPEGAIALPADLPVAWAPAEIQSQKHVLIACHWPKAADILPVTARHMFARQLCGKVDQVFWN